jgi:hypothetical protein
MICSLCILAKNIGKFVDSLNFIDMMFYIWCLDLTEPTTLLEVKGDGTPRKLATATRPQFPRKIVDFKQATDFEISRRTLRKPMFE